MPALEVMLRRLANESMRGDQKAIKFLLSLVDRYSEPSQQNVQLRDLLAEDEEILAQYLRSSMTSSAEDVAEPHHGESSSD